MKRSGIVLTLVLAAFLLPRLVGLGAWGNPDGVGLWFGRTERFWHGLVNGDLAAMIPAPHPGVMLTWLSGASIYAAHSFGAFEILPTDVNPITKAAALPWAALPVALITAAFGVFLFVWFRRRLGSNWAGLLAVSFLLADPFWISQSRQFHLDALSISFALTGLLLFPLRPFRPIESRSRLRLVVSGILFGLAILTRLTTGIIPAILLVYWAVVRQESWREWFKRAGGLIAAAVGTIIVLWPAVLVHPVEVLRMLAQGADWAIGGVSDLHDQPAVFEPLVLLTRVPLLVLVLAIGGWFLKRWAVRSHTERLLAVVGIGWFLTIWLAPKSLDRYLLTTTVCLDLLAGLALVHIIRMKKWRRPALAATVLTLAVSLVTLVRFLPYESLARTTLHHWLAPRLIGTSDAFADGWGEGLPQVGAYLDTLAFAPGERVSAWYTDTLAPYTHAPLVALTDLPSTYLVVYHNQIARDIAPAIVAALAADSTPPLYSVSVAGQPIAWVYKTPDALNHLAGDPRKLRPGGSGITREQRWELLHRQGIVHD